MAELMKGNKWNERKHLVEYPVWVEIKYDEIRCHVKVLSDEVQILSYAGKPLCNMDRFKESFRKLADTTGFFEFDCGFEVNSNFNDSYRWVRSSKGVPLDLNTAVTLFILFDLPSVDGVLQVRQLHCQYVLAQSADCDLLMSVPEGKWAHNENDVYDLFRIARAAGVEGLMIKNTTHKYERKRTDGWLKMKPSNDADGIIVGFTEAVASRDFPELNLKAGDGLGRAGSLEVLMPDGSKASPSGIAFDLGFDIYNNFQDKYIGRWCEFKYMEIDRQGGYRHPVFNRIREDK